MDSNSLRTADDVAREMVAQPALFLEFDGLDGLSPVELPLVSGPSTDTTSTGTLGRYTGERSTLDDERLLKVGALALLGASHREIEQACRVTRRTIPLLLDHLEKSGRITPLKDRLAKAVAHNAEATSVALSFLISKIGTPGVGTGDSDLAAMIKATATALGITTEKLLLLTGQATQILETKAGAGRADFESWWASVVKSAGPGDSDSPGPSAIPQQTGPIVEVGHESVTATATDGNEPSSSPTTQGGGQDGSPGGQPITH